MRSTIIAVTVAAGSPQPAQVTLQGVIEEAPALVKTTNAVVLRVP